MYKPNPIDTSDVVLSAELLDITEKLAENAHDVWAQGRIEQGWTYGEQRDDIRKTTPCLVPYDQLPDEEKRYDRETAMGTIRLLVKMGYEIRKKA